jgi:CIC family chloride channel protein
MGALFAGIVRAPMTSVLMIFEMTRDYTVIVPLMIANLTSFFISSRFQKQPIYEALAHQDGIHLPTSATRHQTSQHTVAQVMQRAPQILPARMSVQGALEETRSSQFHIWPVAEGDYFLGMVSKEMLESASADEKNEQPLKAVVETLRFPHLHTDHALHQVLEEMSACRVDVLPVVHRAEIHKLLGVVTLREVLDSYGVNGMGPK